ncbi:MAG: MaoC family dehydratase [Beijerinckiaceae bacterium]|nr:MaoC family dehydratase [Beijerinckiaceae bacterium]
MVTSRRVDQPQVRAVPFRYFDDFVIGETVSFGERTISKEEIVAFAKVFDQQPMHVDEDAAKSSFVGRLIASGWHTISLNMRMIVDGVLLESASMGAPGVTSMKWLKPVLPGDTLSSRFTATDKKVSITKPDRGFVTMKIECLNQRGEVVMEQINPVMFGRRPEGALTPPLPATRMDPLPLSTFYGADGRIQCGFEPAKVGPDDDLTGFHDMEIGKRTEIGACTFSTEDIILFARAFDPQPFHIDEEAAKASHFGGLIASGWQTAGVWMHLMIENRERRGRMMRQKGLEPPTLGPSPGFTDLRWLKPVYAGDRLTYSSTLREKRPSQSRPGWGMVSHLNQAFNQRDELVFEFKGNVFWQIG